MLRIVHYMFLAFVSALLLFPGFSFSQTKTTPVPNATIEEQTITEYMVIAGSGKDFPSLEATAKELSKKTGIPYDDLGRIYKDSLLVWPDSIDDELYRGVYVFRRWANDPITIEMNIIGVCYNPSPDKPAPLLMIVAGLYGTKKEANERLAMIKKYIPTAYIKKKEVYMGCMH